MTLLYTDVTAGVDPPRAVGAGDVRSLFDRLSAEWKAGTETTSNLREVLMHPAHLKIIGLGRDGLPLILDDLRRGGGPWYLALASIARDGPAGAAGEPDAKARRAAWLEWGRGHGYVPAEPGL